MEKEYLFSQVDLKRGDIVRVTVDRRANVLMMIPEAYENYKHQINYTYYGGYAITSPLEIPAPFEGKFYVVIDLPGGGELKYSIAVVKGE